MFQNLFNLKIAQVTKTPTNWNEALLAQTVASKGAEAVNPQITTVKPAANGTEQIKSPTNIQTGIVPIPEGTAEPSIVRVTVNTNGQSSATTIVIGRGNLYAIKGGTGWTSNPSGTVYSGTPSNNRYPLFTDDLATNTYLFAMVTIEAIPSAGDTTDGANARAQLFENWLRISGDIQGSYHEDEVQISDARNPFQQDNAITQYAFKNDEGRLDSLSCYVMPAVLPFVELRLRFHQYARGNGRI